MSTTMQVAEPTKGARTFAEQVRLAILQDLASGALRPGEPLDEKLLCERFGVSRTPVREAFLQLVAQGFAVNEARSSVTIPKLSLQRLRDILELIAELEATAARLAARRATAAERQAILVSLEQGRRIAADGTARTYEAANDEFHRAIWSASHNELLEEQVRQMRTKTAGYTRNRFDSPGRMQRSVEEHHAVALAIANGDEAAAWQAMSDHIAIGGRDFAEFVSGIPASLLSV
ncbi:GntR family transcriptional regulator [Hydrogenophaga sp.]|uniref:GntR family transcriptional regulator n=2 Tax=Pseudomonadota TaxID=1224 RepID=UPI00403642DC